MKNKHSCLSKTATLCILFFCTSVLYAQKDSLTTNPNRPLVKGFYKNYQEFIDNNPSIKADFFTTIYRVGKKDTTITSADYHLRGSQKKIKNVWGFCDGKHVFVRYGIFLEKKYWKLQCKGPNPYFYHKYIRIPLEPSFIGFFNLIYSNLFNQTDLKTGKRTFQLGFINNKGISQNASHKYLKTLVKDNRVLYKEIKKETIMPDSLRIRYIIRYNESKMLKAKS